MSNIAITGWGLISEMGNDEQQILKSYDEKTEVKGGSLEFDHNLKPAKIRRMGRLAKMSAAVSEKCLAMSQAEPGDNTGIIMNTDYGSINLNIEFGKVLKTPDLSSPSDFANTVSNAALGHVTLYFGLKGASTLLMGSNGLSYTIRQLEKKPEQKIIFCGADEYCEPIANYAKEKYGKNVVSEGVGAVILENNKNSDWGYIVGDAQSGIGYSPLYQDTSDVKDNYKGVIEKALKEAGLKAEDVDLVLMSGDAGSGVRAYEEAAVVEIFGEDKERRFIKDELGECFGASAVSSVIVGSVLVKNNRYKKVLVLGTEVSGTIEAYVVSKERV
ncbi:hypothetical protein [Butyrivibrio sp. YAB3001]|uniref:hypothetical protein n=1 Tax=Butyrivibrio sp. YAB3001 TaxID=1520812 RepID=UPI0008F67683|nr:hypothetical protein [Butyrivibrio sp. YAB3001]SFC12806.1 3-oxoacyl-(acyl-carrier-protein) synthase [Butyrivibrio sp. YAB3001]